ncbi:MAG: hypothetical protein NVS3B18_00460 [Candidatus Dormibacteria bacterium]
MNRKLVAAGSALVLAVLLFASALTFLVASRSGTNQSPPSTPLPGQPSAFPANFEHDQTGYGVYETRNLSNPAIGGVGVNMNWADVEPQQGVFNWKPADDEISAWVVAGKTFDLLVRYASDFSGKPCSATLQYLPAWAAARVPTLCSSAGNLLPNYFDPTFQADLESYVSAVAQHIAASDHAGRLAYIRVGVGVAGEGYPCIACSPGDLENLTAWGYSAAAWATWQEQMLTVFQRIFSGASAAPLIYPLGDNTVDPATGQPVSQEVGYWAAAHGMGVGQQGLKAAPAYARGEAVQIAQYVHARYPAVYIEFQTNQQITQTSPDPAEVAGDIAIANSAYASSIEWYGPDTIVSAYQPFFREWQQAVKARTTATPSL